MKKKKKIKVYDVLLENVAKMDTECVHFPSCGGCRTQDVRYELELKLKEEYVLSLLSEFSGYEYEGIVENPLPNEYRNKMEFSFGDCELGGELALGMRKKGRYYEVQNAHECNIVDADFRLILSKTLEFFSRSEDTFYHQKNKTGALRHLVVRKGYFLGEILINLETAGGLKTDLDLFVNMLVSLSLKGKIVGVLHTINDGVADVVKPEFVRTIFGQDFFTERLNGLAFNISAFSFFQTNSAGACKLYDTVSEYVGETKDKIVFDLYCGTGTITQIVASSAKKSIGIDIVDSAIKSAKENAVLNNLDNVSFICGDVLKAVDLLTDSPDVIILDPPREGIHPKAIKKIIAFDAPEIVYVSCKPSSLANDGKILEENGYKLKKIRLHDMFSKTANIETVALFKKVVFTHS